MKIVITGASGFVGRRIMRRYGGDAHAISLRTPPKPEDLVGAVVVVNLAGEPVAQRWNADVKDRIRKSRVEGTRLLVEAIAHVSPKPLVLVSASAVGYYGSRGDEILTESSAPGSDFLASVTQEWEHEALAAEHFGVRVVCLRFGHVLGREGGMLKKLLLPFSLGIGGRIGDGQQWMPWIHADDLVSMIDFAVQTESVRGVLNATAPNPVCNVEFTRELGRALHRPEIFPVPKAALHIIFGEMAQIVYASQRAIPEAALKGGFEFQFAELRDALTNLLG